MKEVIRKLSFSILLISVGLLLGLSYLVSNLLFRRKQIVTIFVARDFSQIPGGKSGGNFSGEEFRENFLSPAFLEESLVSKLIINLDGTCGYATSFLKEAFGELAKEFGKAKVLKKIEFISTEEPLLIEEIKSYIMEA